MFRDVPGCSGMFHVPGFIDGPFFNPNPLQMLVKFSKNMLLAFGLWFANFFLQSMEHILPGEAKPIESAVYCLASSQCTLF